LVDGFRGVIDALPIIFEFSDAAAAMLLFLMWDTMEEDKN
jgi:hypothetical protein